MSLDVLRVSLQQDRELHFCLGRASSLSEDISKAIARRGEVRVEIERGLIFPDALFRAACRDQRVAEVEAALCIARVNLQGHAPLVDGLRGPALGQQQVGKVISTLWEIRIERDERPLILPGGFVAAALVAKSRYPSYNCPPQQLGFWATESSHNVSSLA